MSSCGNREPEQGIKDSSLRGSEELDETETGTSTQGVPQPDEWKVLLVTLGPGRC